MFTFLSSLFSPGFKLDPGQRRNLVRGAFVAVLLLVLFVGLQLGRWARGSLPGEDPRSDLQVVAAVLLLRVPVALAFAAVAALLVVVVFRIIEKTRLGHQLITWRIGQETGVGDAKDAAQEDPENVPAARTLGTFIFLGCLFLGLCQLFSAAIR